MSSQHQPLKHHRQTAPAQQRCRRRHLGHPSLGSSAPPPCHPQCLRHPRLKV
jgi:hypothetical protein